MKPPLMDRKMQTWVLLPVTCHPTLDSTSSIALRIPGGQVTILNDQECAWLPTASEPKAFQPTAHMTVTHRISFIFNWSNWHEQLTLVTWESGLLGWCKPPESPRLLTWAAWTPAGLRADSGCTGFEHALPLPKLFLTINCSRWLDSTDWCCPRSTFNGANRQGILVPLLVVWGNHCWGQQ